jgi:hypothetical protein
MRKVLVGLAAVALAVLATWWLAHLGDVPILIAN